MTVDVQHDRLAVNVWVFGRGEEMWIAFWGEFYGATLVPHESAWIELAQMMDQCVRHSTGRKLPIRTVGINSFDAQVNDAVCSFARKHNQADRQVNVLQGASYSVGRVEIWTQPKRMDPNARATKATRAGVTVCGLSQGKGFDPGLFRKRRPCAARGRRPCAHALVQGDQR